MAGGCSHNEPSTVEAQVALHGALGIGGIQPSSKNLQRVLSAHLKTPLI